MNSADRVGQQCRGGTASGERSRTSASAGVASHSRHVITSSSLHHHFVITSEAKRKGLFEVSALSLSLQLSHAENCWSKCSFTVIRITFTCSDFLSSGRRTDRVCSQSETEPKSRTELHLKPPKAVPLTTCRLPWLLVLLCKHSPTSFRAAVKLKSAAHTGQHLSSVKAEREPRFWFVLQLDLLVSNTITGSCLMKHHHSSASQPPITARPFRTSSLGMKSDKKNHVDE